MKKLIILGGGFAGAKIAKALENIYDVILIDSKDYFEFTPGILRSIVNHQHLKKIQIPHNKYLKKARVITDKVKEITKNPNKEITIIHKNNKLMERNHAKAISYADKFLKKKGVKFIFNENAINYNNNYIKTNKGTKIKANMVFLCTGIKPNSQPLEKYFKNALNEKKQIKVNDFLQIENYENIFAAGDITNIKEEKLAQNQES